MPDVKPRANRLYVSMRVYVRGEDVNGVPFDMEVESLNISRNGLAFHSPHEIAMAAPLDIVVQRSPLGPREFPPLFTSGKVMRVAPAEGGGFNIGIEFTGPKLMMFAAESEPS